MKWNLSRNECLVKCYRLCFKVYYVTTSNYVKITQAIECKATVPNIKPK